jgi:hypothetical protein
MHQPGILLLLGAHTFGGAVGACVVDEQDVGFGKLPPDPPRRSSTFSASL